MCITLSRRKKRAYVRKRYPKSNRYLRSEKQVLTALKLKIRALSGHIQLDTNKLTKGVKTLCQ